MGGTGIWEGSGVGGAECGRDWRAGQVPCRSTAGLWSSLSVHLRSGGDLQGSAASGKCWVLGHTQSEALSATRVEAGCSYYWPVPVSSVVGRVGADWLCGWA